MLVCFSTLQFLPLQTSYFYVSLLSLSTPSSCPVCGPVFDGKGVRFTTSEDVYPDKGMWHSGPELETSRTTRKPPDQSPTPSTLHSHPPHVHPKTPPACSNSSQQTNAMHSLNILPFHSISAFFLSSPQMHTHTHTCPPQQYGHILDAFMHVMYTLMSVCTELHWIHTPWMVCMSRH